MGLQGKVGGGIFFIYQIPWRTEHSYPGSQDPVVAGVVQQESVFPPLLFHPNRVLLSLTCAAPAFLPGSWKAQYMHVFMQLVPDKDNVHHSLHSEPNFITPFFSASTFQISARNHDDVGLNVLGCQADVLGTTLCETFLLPLFMRWSVVEYALRPHSPKMYRHC